MVRPKSRAPARQAALSMVARRQLTGAEVRLRLTRRDYSTAEIDDAIALLAEYGYLDEAAVVDAVRREARRTGRGPQWLRLTLLRRGVNAADADAAALAEEATAGERAANVVSARFGELSALDLPTRSRARRHLFSRGYSIETIHSLLGEEL